ncbi:uncharacterized protein LOC114931248 [Nylanderia fulva]|uniref:uncharacterized protein LOC114931248 n=1 Tax=Nylanderia fulva TaxID=613905 RepID=UPI0010FAD966|nr:uncharacterized protein LOC114931248 [Nylanderia fulva]
MKADLKGLGIEGANVRKGASGSYILEISGPDGKEKADKLALELKRVLANKEGVKIQRPTKMAELRFRGLDESIRTPEVREAIARNGNCEEVDVHTGEIKKTPGGMGIVWVRCPLRAANLIMKQGR